MFLPGYTVCSEREREKKSLRVGGTNKNSICSKTDRQTKMSNEIMIHGMRDGINKQRQTYLQRERVKEREIVRRWVHKDTYKHTYRERERESQRERRWVHKDMHKERE